MKTSEIVTFCYLRGQSIELLRRSLQQGAGGCQLSLANGVHDLHLRERTTSSPQGLEAQHQSHQLFHHAVILLHDSVEILALPDRDADRVGPIRTVLLPLWSILICSGSPLGENAWHR